ncbi:MAG TPA: GNAT family N-acetyltransferase [bacterium]|nr:GNAT family N-acetyltransferase [bacterium]
MAALCRAAVGADDYVLEYLPEMIARREILVTVVGRRVRAMTGLTECADGALWIGQLRTHPRWRRRGLARMLLDRAYARVVRESRSALRLWTSQRNVAARALFESNGFRPVAVFSRMVAAPLAGRAQWRTAPTSSERQGLLSLWDRSLFGREGKGYLDYFWRFTRLNQPVVRRLLDRRELFFNSLGVFLMWRGAEHRTTVHVAVLTGGKAALRSARRAAGARGFDRVQAFVPRTRRALATARQAGFAMARWGTRAVLYERPA